MALSQGYRECTRERNRDPANFVVTVQVWCQAVMSKPSVLLGLASILVCWLSYRQLAHSKRVKAMDINLYLAGHYKHPCQVLGIPWDRSRDEHHISARFAHLFEAVSRRHGPGPQLQILCSTFQLLMCKAPNSTAHQQHAMCAEKQAHDAALEHSQVALDQLKRQHEAATQSLQRRAQYAEEMCLQRQAGSERDSCRSAGG
jgi:hypothetical protein